MIDSTFFFFIAAPAYFLSFLFYLLKIVLDAEAYAKQVVERAKGEGARFDSLLAAYKMAPEVTRKRLYMDTMEQVMSKADKIIVDGAVADKVLPYLPLNRSSGKVEVQK